MKSVFAGVLLALSMLFSVSCEATSITATWDYDFTITQPCSVASPTNCIKDFALYVVGSTTLSATCPAPATATGPVTGLTCTVQVPSKIGLSTFVIRARAVDWQGNAVLVESIDSNQSPLTSKPGPPANFLGK